MQIIISCLFNDKLCIRMCITKKSQHTINVIGLSLLRIIKISSTYLTQKFICCFNSLLNYNFSIWNMNILTNNGPTIIILIKNGLNGLPFTIPLTCWYNKPSNKNILFFVHNSSNFFKSFSSFNIANSLFLYILSKIKLIVLFMGTWVSKT